MCGILGSFSHIIKKCEFDYFRAALDVLDHRGPDDDGIEQILINKGRLLFGQKRLSIIDLSIDAHQPMQSSSGRYLLIYNGEIYNYRELKLLLISKNYKFKTNSDTEVLLTAWEEWGVDCLHKLKGMFAFSIYDKFTKEIFISRDAFGIKPLFYSLNENKFTFASEINALLKINKDRQFKANEKIAYNYLVHNTYDFSQETFIEDIFTLEPGSYLIYDINSKRIKEIKNWWQPKYTFKDYYSYEDSVEKIRELFLSSLKLHMRSDVPIGAALSGGIDSSAIVCGMRYLYPKENIHTFSYVASDKKINEEKWIDFINDHTKSIPHKITIDNDRIIYDLDNLINAQGEPFGSTSNYAQYCIYQKVQACGIKVILDGQGADELFAGYNGYVGSRILSLIEKNDLKKAFDFILKWRNSPNRSIYLALKEYARVSLPNKLYAKARFYQGRNFKPNWLNMNKILELKINCNEEREQKEDFFRGRRVTECLINAVNKRGLRSLLRNADRNSMHFSIEGRVPFLSCDLAEYVYSLPEEFLISQNGTTKYIFRDAMKDIVPDKILNRKDKIGFETPQLMWIKNNKNKFRTKIEELSSNNDLINKNILKKYDNILSSGKDINQAWRFINYAIWHNQFIC